MGHWLDNKRKRARVGAWGLWALFVVAWLWLRQACDRPGGPPQDLLLLALLGAGSALILIRPRPRKIPVLNYHSVSDRPRWLQLGPKLSLTPAAFEQHLIALQRRGYRTVFISELHALLRGATPCRRGDKYVALTFDDGYADNWVAAFPLLRKYGMKATLFVNTDFVEPTDRVRPTRDEVAPAGDVPPGGVEWEGYLSWGELRAMKASGQVEIQAHGTGHTRVFGARDLRGFVSPQQPNLWLHLNAHPEHRTRWWQALPRDQTLWGHPVFRQKPALAHRAFRPDPAAVAHVLDWTRAQGPALFERPDWEKALRRQWQTHLAAHGDTSAWETDEAYAQRVRDDLRAAKRVLEERLDERVDFLCWPENAFTAIGERIAAELGYQATVSNRHDSVNRIGQTPDRIARVFVGSQRFGVACGPLDRLAFLLELKTFEGYYVCTPLLLAAALARKLLSARTRGNKHDYLSAWG